MDKKKKEKKSKSLKPLFSLVKGQRTKISIAIVMAILSTCFSIIAPKILGDITTSVYDGVVKNKDAGIDFDKIFKMLMILLILYLISALLQYLQGLIMNKITYITFKKLTDDVSNKIHKLPISFYDKVEKGDIISRVTNDIDTVTQTLRQNLSEIISSSTKIIGIIIIMFYINWQMTLASLVIIPIVVVLTFIIVKKTQKYFKNRQKKLASINSHVEESISNHLVVKAFNAEAKTIEKFEEESEELYETSWKSQFFSGLLMPIIRVCTDLGYVVVTIIGASFAVIGMITVGNIQAFLQYLRNFNMPIMTLSSTSNILQKTAAASERILEFLNEEEEHEYFEIAEDANKIKGQISFKNVYFGYDEKNKVIKNFSAEFKQGEKIAIVGPTGSGKTTLVKLLMRYYNVNEGEILIDRLNINNFTRSDLRNEFAMVLQDTWLFNGTIMENIKYGKLNATDEEAIEAAKKANVDSFVKTLPKSYQMEINEETSNISEGQKQLITIARAILSKPKILIFDEATSSVDTRTELHIQEAMDNLMKGRTSFVIAHRLSTIKNADTILVLNEGNIVEQGNHKSLLEKNGFYANLYNSQFSK